MSMLEVLPAENLNETINNIGNVYVLMTPTVLQPLFEPKPVDAHFLARGSSPLGVVNPVGVGVAPKDMAGTPKAGAADIPADAPNAGTVCCPKAVEVPNVGADSLPDDAELPNVLGDPKADEPEAAPKLPNDGSALLDACDCPNVGTGAATVALAPPVLPPNISSGVIDCGTVAVVVADRPGIVFVAPKTGAHCCALPMPKEFCMEGATLFAGAKKFVTFADGVAVLGVPKDGAATAVGGVPVDGDPKANVDFVLSVAVLEITGTAPKVSGLLFSIVGIVLVTADVAPNVGILSEFAGVTTFAIELPPNANVVAVDDAGVPNTFGASIVFNGDGPPKLNAGFAASTIGLSTFG